jgi:hypothetical protein
VTVTHQFLNQLIENSQLRRKKRDGLEEKGPKVQLCKEEEETIFRIFNITLYGFQFTSVYLNVNFINNQFLRFICKLNELQNRIFKSIYRFIRAFELDD